MTLKDKLTGSKFLLTLGAILGAVSAGLAGAMTWPLVVQAIVVAMVPYILGQSYIEGKVAEFVPPAVQQQLIENAAVALANKYVGNKKADVENVLRPMSVTLTNATVSPIEPPAIVSSSPAPVQMQQAAGAVPAPAVSGAVFTDFADAPGGTGTEQGDALVSA